jgi:hypothetical protein
MVDFAGGDDGPRIRRAHPVDGGTDVVIGYVGAVADNHWSWLVSPPCQTISKVCSGRKETLSGPLED